MDRGVFLGLGFEGFGRRGCRSRRSLRGSLGGGSLGKLTFWLLLFGVCSITKAISRKLVHSRVISLLYGARTLGN